MTPDGPHPFGVGPDDPGGGDSSDEGGPDDAVLDAVVKGWLPPEQRIWRHPSELSAAVPAWLAVPSSGAGGAGGMVSWSSRRRMATSLVATGAAVAVIVGVVLMNTVGSGRGTGLTSASVGPPTSATTAYTTEVPNSGVVPGAAITAARGMVSLQFTTPSGTSRGCGVAVAEGGLVVTTAEVLAGATSGTAALPGGRTGRAELVAEDPGSGVALLRVPFDLPVPQFDSTADPAAGQSAMVLTASPATAGPPAWKWSRGTIDGTAAPVGSGSSGLTGISAFSSAPALPGGVLVEGNGDIVGLLDHAVTAPGGQSAQAFVPSWLVLGVSGELAAWGTVRHGWLDVTADDVPGPGYGALVESVDPGGASAQVLRAGDVIVGVGSSPVRSAAELRELLYLLAPGTPVRLRVVRNGVVTAAVVDLGPSATTTAGQP